MKLVLVRKEGVTLYHFDGQPQEIDVSNIIAEWEKSSQEKILDWDFVEDENIPNDRKNRDKWALDKENKRIYES